MQRQVNESKKSFDATISKIADNIKSELHLNDPLFIAIMNPETQCLHYIGRSYYQKIISSYEPERIKVAVSSVQSTINKSSLGHWYNDIKAEERDQTDVFIDLLLNTPISRYYRLSGRAYNAGSPVFFYTKKQFNLYRDKFGKDPRYLKHDPILGQEMDSFGNIIDELEKIFFDEQLLPANGMMTPIYLYGQIIGAVFLGDRSETKFNYYDYLRLLQIIKESAVTLIKDAMEYEFLSAVLKDMLDSGLLNSILRNLPKLFNISGACMKDANGNCLQLIFKKNDAECIPKWAILPCNHNHNHNTSCVLTKYSGSNGKEHEHSNIISKVDICNNHTDSLLDLKSGIHIVKEGLNIIAYFSSESDVLETYKRGLGLALDDALELLFVEEQVKQEITKHALRAAIAAIMSRNMSHNIGSHVLARISSKGIDGFPESENTDDIVKGLNDENNAKEVINWCRDVQILSQYLQQRQDFIAQIATEWPEWTYPAWLMKDLMRWFLSQKHLINYIGSSENLEAHFYTQENTENDIRFHAIRSCREIWDKRIWHCYEDLSCDGIRLWREAIRNVCPLHNNREDAGNCSDHKCNKETSCKLTEKYVLLYTDQCIKRNECHLDEDIQLAMPGGIVGYHAFYTIFENVIRNGAKHSFTKMKKLKEEYKQGKYDNLVKAHLKNEVEERLKIAFGESMDDIHMDVIVEFFDEDKDVKNDGKKYKDKQNKTIPYYRFRVYDNVSFANSENKPLKNSDDTELVKTMNNHFRQDIITETGELRKENWGLAEMRISAGYLQGRDISHIGMGGDRITNDPQEHGDKKDEGFIIRATVSPLGTLAFEFRIPKPKEVGILCK